MLISMFFTQRDSKVLSPFLKKKKKKKKMQLCKIVNLYDSLG